MKPQFRIAKNPLLSLLFISILSSPALKAQEYHTYYEPDIRLGLSINPSMNWLSYDNDYNVARKTGFSYGLVADFGFATNYYFSTGLLINAINSRVETGISTPSENQPDVYTNRDISLRYAELPLGLKLKSTLNNTGQFYGLFGFTAGVRVSARELLDSETRRRDIEGADLFRLGLQIGGGYEWQLFNNLSMITGLSYNNGFTRAIQHESPRSSFVALNIGIIFN